MKYINRTIATITILVLSGCTHQYADISLKGMKESDLLEKCTQGQGEACYLLSKLTRRKSTMIWSCKLGYKKACERLSDKELEEIKNDNIKKEKHKPWKNRNISHSASEELKATQYNTPEKLDTICGGYISSRKWRDSNPYAHTGKCVEVHIKIYSIISRTESFGYNVLSVNKTGNRAVIINAFGHTSENISEGKIIGNIYRITGTRDVTLTRGNQATASVLEKIY